MIPRAEPNGQMRILPDPVRLLAHSPPTGRAGETSAGETVATQHDEFVRATAMMALPTRESMPRHKGRASPLGRIAESATEHSQDTV